MTKKKNIDGILDSLDEFDRTIGKKESSPAVFDISPETDHLVTEVVIDIPYNTIKPVNQRIFAVAFDPGEQKTKGGIIIPTKFATAESEERKKKDYKRYYVVDFADDCTLPLKRAMEISPFFPEDSIGFTFPEVIDWGNGRRYTTFHQSELAGYSLEEITVMD